MSKLNIIIQIEYRIIKKITQLLSQKKYNQQQQMRIIASSKPLTMKQQSIRYLSQQSSPQKITQDDDFNQLQQTIEYYLKQIQITKNNVDKYEKQVQQQIKRKQLLDQLLQNYEETKKQEVQQKQYLNKQVKKYSRNAIKKVQQEYLQNQINKQKIIQQKKSIQKQKSQRSQQQSSQQSSNWLMEEYSAIQNYMQKIEKTQNQKSANLAKTYIQDNRQQQRQNWLKTNHKPYQFKYKLPLNYTYVSNSLAETKLYANTSIQNKQIQANLYQSQLKDKTKKSRIFGYKTKIMQKKQQQNQSLIINKMQNQNNISQIQLNKKYENQQQTQLQKRYNRILSKFRQFQQIKQKGNQKFKVNQIYVNYQTEPKQQTFTNNIYHEKCNEFLRNNTNQYRNFLKKTQRQNRKCQKLVNSIKRQRLRIQHSKY